MDNTSSLHTGEQDAQAAPRLQVVGHDLTQLNERAISFIRARPATCLLGALALGFIVGKIAARY